MKGVFKVKCPICQSNTKVLQTNEEQRRRECKNCGYRYTTIEQIKKRNDDVVMLEIDKINKIEIYMEQIFNKLNQKIDDLEQKLKEEELI